MSNPKPAKGQRPWVNAFTLASRFAAIARRREAEEKALAEAECRPFEPFVPPPIDATIATENGQIAMTVRLPETVLEKTDGSRVKVKKPRKKKGIAEQT